MGGCALSAVAAAACVSWASSCTLFVDFNNQREEPTPEASAVVLDRALADIDDIVAFGDRHPGTNEDLARAVAQKFEDIGLTDVSIEQFAVPTFAPLESAAAVAAPADLAQALEHEVNQFAGDGDVVAEVFDLGNGRAVRPEAAGKIVLIDALQTASIRVQYDSAIASGAAGVFFNSNVDGGFLRQRHVWRFERKGDLVGPIPAVSVSKENALRIRDALQRGIAVNASLRMQTGVEFGTGHTVVARIPGTRFPDQRIVINAHIDSWFGGVVDNVQGVAALFELARVFQQFPPAYTIELVAFDVEETGLLGSADYLRQRSPDARVGIAAAITLEMLAPLNPELTIASSDPLARDEEDAPWERVLADSRLGTLFETQLGAGDFMVAFNGEIPLDQKNFWENGIPGFFVVTTYGPFHTNADGVELTDDGRYDAVLRAIVDAVRLLQDVPPEQLRRPPASWIDIQLVQPLAPKADEPLAAEVELLSSAGDPLDGIAVVATLHDEPGTTLLDEAVVTPLGAGRYQIEFAAPAQTTGRHVLSVSGVGGLRSGRTWFRVLLPD